jgi:hypothetical protein
MFLGFGMYFYSDIQLQVSSVIRNIDKEMLTFLTLPHSNTTGTVLVKLYSKQY